MIGTCSGVAVPSAGSLASFGRGLICAAVVLVASCSTEPGDIFSIGATVFGTVSRSGLPVAGVEVRSTLFRPECVERVQATSPDTTDDQGRYRKVMVFGLTAPGTPFCVEVRAVFERDGVADSVTISDIPITMSGFAGPNQPADSFRVDIALPP